jgi:DNA-binding transcriptional MerR regulator
MEYSIHEIARIFGITPGGVRYYEDAGLVHPRRDYNDTRKYSFDNILELFYHKKYGNFGFKIKEVGEYFIEPKHQSIDEITRLLEKRQEEAEARARAYQNTAQWIAWYRERLRSLDESMDHFIPQNPPDSLVLMDEDLVGKSRQRQDVIRQWIDASPMARITQLSFFREAKLVETRHALLIDKLEAEKRGLPLSGARTLKGPAMHRVVRLKGAGSPAIPPEVFEGLIGELEAGGLGFAGLAISNVFFTHCIEQVQYHYFEIWMPVNGENPLSI